MKLRGEYHHEIAVVAPTGFEPVFQSRPSFRFDRARLAGEGFEIDRRIPDALI